MWNNSSSPSSNCETSFVVLALDVSQCTFQVLLLFPLSLYALFYGYRRWVRQRSITNSDFFTYNLSAIHLIVAVGITVYVIGKLSSNPGLKSRGSSMRSFIYSGELLIHPLTCVDRYLAVVYPIAYMKCKQNIRVCIRNLSISIVWLLCFGYVGLQYVYYPDYPYIVFTCILVSSLFVICFCCVSVLCVLIRPKPGHLDRVDQSKRRALHTMLAITAVLLVWALAFVIDSVMVNFVVNPIHKCVIFYSLVWLNIPSSLVLYVLLFHRAGKFTFAKKYCCKN